MKIRISLTLLALATMAAPASAQIRSGSTDRVRDVILGGDRRAETRTRNGTMGDIIFGGSRDRTGDTRESSRVPRGHLPPRGMCRIWVDGVPPGQQPPVTSCADAERNRIRYGANARVIYGDDQAFPGKGKKGKVKKQDRSRTDVFGRRIENDDEDSDDEDSDDDRFERRRDGDWRVAAETRKNQGKKRKG